MFSSPKKELKDTLGVVQQVCYLDSDDGIDNVAYVQTQRFPVNQLSSKKVVIKKQTNKKKKTSQASDPYNGSFQF